MTRKYTHIKMFENEIINMKKQGKTHREIAEHFNLEKEQIKEFYKRYKRSQRKAQLGILPLKKGRPRKDFELTEENKVEYYKRQLRFKDYDNERLKMENELLRDFLHLAGRM